MAFLRELNTSMTQTYELDLFRDAPNQVVVHKLYFSETRPISSFDNDSAPLEFLIPGNGSEYLDLRKSRLYVKAKSPKRTILH